MPAPAAVQNAEPSLTESLTKIVSRFSTEFSTVMLKTFNELELGLADTIEDVYGESNFPQSRRVAFCRCLAASKGDSIAKLEALHDPKN